MPPTVQSRAVTEGGIWLMWVPGQPPTTSISNITTRTSTNVGLVTNYVMRGLPMGSTNTFVAFNTNGLSNTATGVAADQNGSCTISIYSFLVTVPTWSNQSTLVFTSTNLLTWQQIALFVTTNKSHQFVWTNDHGARYFRSIKQ